MRRHVVNGVILSGMVLAFWACSSTPPAKTTTHPDAGHSDAGPDAGESASGSSGSTGSVASSSSSGTASSGGSGSSGSGSSGTCAHRSDCPTALACLSGVCGVEGPDAGCSTNDQCVKTYICEAGKCDPGCDSNLDCHGTNLPKCIVGNPGHCSACTANADCQLAGEPSTANEVCQNGRCVQPAACTTAATCGDIGCVNGFCASCTSDANCIPGTTHCDPAGSGNCLSGADTCTTDAACVAANGNAPGWFCSSSGACKLGCPAASECSPPVAGCCNPSISTCSATTHTCIALATGSTSTGSIGTTTGSTGTNSTGTSGSTGAPCDCSPCTNLGEGCDQANNCSCVPSGTTGTNGTNGSPCDCSPCTALGEGCDPNNNCNCVPSSTTGGTSGTADPCCATQSSSDASGCAIGIPFICSLFGGCCDPIACCAGAAAPGTTGTTGSTGTGCPSTHNSGDPCDASCKCAGGLTCMDGSGNTYVGSSSSDAATCAQNVADMCTDGLTCQ